MLSASEGKREASEEHQTRPRRACPARHDRPFHPCFRSPEKREKLRPVLQAICYSNLQWALVAHICDEVNICHIVSAE